MNERLSLVLHAVAGWAICGATIGLGRRVAEMDTVLVVHAAVAPLAFGVLGWHHFRRHPGAGPLPTAAAMLAIVVALDALLVAPLFEHSYAMFRSFAGTWLPFGLIFGATYLAGRVARRATAGAAT